MAYIYSDESFAINGAAYDVYRKLKFGFLEAVYQEAFEIELKERGIPYEREKELQIIYNGKPLQQTYRADFVCYGKIIVELKAVSELTETHISQVYNYLHATGYKLGLLYNFGAAEKVEFKRIVM